MNYLNVLAGGAVILCVSGCMRNIVVNDGEQEIKGIPFYVKESVMVQKTKVLQTETAVSLDIKLSQGKVTKEYKYPGSSHSWHFKCANPQQLMGVLKEQLDTVPPPGSMSESDAYLERLNALEPAIRKSLVQESCQKTIENSWAVEMRAGQKKYYIANRVPWFGTASANFTFAEDGTLTSSESSVTDDTAKTLLSLFPIKEKLTKQWGLAPATPALVGKKKPTPAPPIELTMDITLSEVGTVFNLKREQFTEKVALEVQYPPLKLDDALEGKAGVQLASQESAAEPPKPPANTKAFTIQGSIIPPEAAAGK